LISTTESKSPFKQVNPSVLAQVRLDGLDFAAATRLGDARAGTRRVGQDSRSVGRRSPRSVCVIDDVAVSEVTVLTRR
jgi:hypothetical protein